MKTINYIIYIIAFIIFILNIFWKKEMINLFGLVISGAIYFVAGVALLINIYFIWRNSKK